MNFKLKSIIFSLFFLLTISQTFAVQVAQINIDTINGGTVTIQLTIGLNDSGDYNIDHSELNLDSKGILNNLTDCSTGTGGIEFINVNNTVIHTDGQIACDYYIDYVIPSNATDGTYEIFHTETGDNIIDINVITTNLITSAETIDSDSNGFIDGYKLIFARSGLTNFSNVGLKVGTLTNVTLSGIVDNVAYINFSDSVYTTGETPEIAHTGAIFDGIDIINPIDISVLDKAEPVVLNVNGYNPSGAVSISENAKLSVQFSENIYFPSVSSSFKIIENGSDITVTSYLSGSNDTVTYCKGGYDSNLNCITPFDNTLSYSISVGSGVIDNSSNKYTGGDLNVSITVLDVTPPVSSSITYNSETNNGIVINGNNGSNGYTNNSAGSVNLSINSTDNSGLVSSMCISENSSLTNNNTCDTSWKSYSATDSFTFTGSEGLKSLYIKFKDAAGNISSVSSDNITWDKTSPTTSINTSGGYFQNGVSLNINLICSDSNSSCLNTYYSLDGSTPSILYTSSITIAGIDEVITLKYFSTDNASNQEGITNTQVYNFSTSYITFNNSSTLTTSTGISLSGTCNESGLETTLEYTLDNWNTTFPSTCSGTWTGSLVLSSNASNTIQTRFQTNTGILSSYVIIHDDIAPTTPSIIINNSDTYSSSSNVTLTISSTDSNGIEKMMISESSAFTGAVWENYNNTKSFSLSNNDETKTIYIKVKDFIGNISNVSNDQIILNTATPSLSSDLSSGSYESTRTVTLTSSDDTYYTTDNSTPTNSSTLYSSSLSLGTTTGIVNLKAIAYSDSGIDSGVKSYTYDFSCVSVSNGSITAYPNCAITCNSGYQISGRTCAAIPSSGGGGSGGSGGVSNADLENIKYISKTKIPLIELIVNKTFRKYGILDVRAYVSKQLTGDNGIIDLRTSNKGLSKLIIPENTSIIGGAELIYAPHSFEIKADLKVSTLKINNKDLPSYNIKKVFFTGDKEIITSFNKEVGLEFNMGEEISGKIYVYHSNSVDGNFSLIKTGLSTDEDGLVKFKSSKLGYFAFVRDIYIARYFGTQTIVVKDINTKNDTEKLVTLLKSKINNSTLSTLIDKYSKALIIPEMDYYVSFDPGLQSKYSSIVKGYVDFISNTDKYLYTKDSKYQIAAANGYKEYLKVYELKNFDEKYVIKIERDGLEIYKTTYTPIAHLVDALENAMLIKLEKLLDADTITQDKYNQTIKDYNEFILHLSIYRKYGNKSAAYKALTPGRRFIKVYKMKVIYNTPLVDKNIILIKDKYNFPSKLEFGDYNEQVRNLQIIMKSYGYFTYPTTTQYFGDVTQSAFLKFSRDILGDESKILTNDLIQKLYQIEYKN